MDKIKNLSSTPPRSSLLYAYLRIFSLTTFQNWKLIPKADFKWECPYYYSKKNLERFGQYLKKSRNGFPIVFPKSEIDRVDRNIHFQNSRKGLWGSLCIGVMIQGGRTFFFHLCPGSTYSLIYSYMTTHSFLETVR